MMAQLSRKFEQALETMGLFPLQHPLFYRAPVGLRFEIGPSTPDTPVYLPGPDLETHMTNTAYLSTALARAQAIYSGLPRKPDILRFDAYPCEDVKDGYLADFRRCTSLPPPAENRLSSLSLCEEEGAVLQRQWYWPLAADYDATPLLTAILHAEIGGGQSWLTSSVYFLDSQEPLLFHLYDDRGADVIAADRESLRSLYRCLNPWLLDYDRAKMDATFTD